MVALEAISVPASGRTPASRLRLAAVLAAGVITGALASAPALAGAFPEGIYALNPGNRAITRHILTNPHVRGVTIRTFWPDVEPERGVYNWSYIDAKLAEVTAARKEASLVVINGGNIGTPGWLPDLGGETFSFVDTVASHSTYGQTLTIPLFWDRTLLDEKKRLIAAMGERYATYPGLRLVSAQCANATTDDWNVPSGNDTLAEWNRVGYDADLLVDACLEILDATMTAFPNQHVRMAFGNVSTRLGWPGNYITTEVIRRGREAWGDRFVAMRHNLSAKTPDPRVAPARGGWEDIVAAAPSTAAQMLWSAVDKTSCRMNGGVKPCDPATMLRTAANVGVEGYGLRFLEIYNSDITNSALSGVIEEIAGYWSEVNLLGVSWNWVNTLPYPKALKPFRQEKLYSFAVGAEVGYTIYLPESYDSNPDRRYPVLYWLHGKNGSEIGAAMSIGKVFVDQIKAGKIRDVILVMPNGGLAMYSNSVDGQIPVETMIINELIPHIDRTYRTIDDRSGRIIEGFSMGGFGALKFAAKYPEMFSSVQIYGAALNDGSVPPISEIYGPIFNNDLSAFAAETPTHWITENQDKILELGLRIRLVASKTDMTWYQNDLMIKLLTEREIPFTPVVFNQVPHDARKYYQADQYGSFAFHEQSLAQFD